MTNVALIFPGQGAQEVGMGKEFYDSSPIAQDVFNKADTIIPGLKDVCFNGPAEKLTSTAFCQPAIFTFSVAALKVLQEHPKFKNFLPQYTAGLSLGEYSALVASGAASFETALKLVERRSSFMEEATRLKKGAMAAIIGFDQGKLVDICKEIGAEVANFNSPDQIVITGDADKVLLASERIKAEGAKRVIPLDVSGAFHSSLMKPAAERFEASLDSVEIYPAAISLLSNVDALPTKDPLHIKKNLSRQIISSVEWVKTIQNISHNGVETFFEIGPGNVLKGLLRKINPALKVFNIQKPSDIEAISA
jgi:[acyl-carrier-protein] S-malonyltransferase